MTTPAPNSPTVSFERQSYSAQVVANSEPTDEIVKVSAVASNQQTVDYSLQQDGENLILNLTSVVGSNVHPLRFLDVS